MGIEADLESPLARAVRAVGSQSAYARLTGQTQGNVHRALSTNADVRPQDVQVLSAATSIPKDVLRPDLFGDVAVTAPAGIAPGSPA